MSSDGTASRGSEASLGRPDPATCVGVVELVTEYLEDALEPDVRARFEAHLDDCEECEVYLEQMRATIVAAGRVDVEHVPPATLDRLVAAYRAAMRARRNPGAHGV
ncbi:MAG: zf-HC2 domain-containing protein [Candidatus Limnocylindrales bacterium]|jgi:anti-sigma factor RsiW|nr:zf-HC2 domain-containing protein [Candidatus Limnocylindrales bacterium]